VVVPLPDQQGRADILAVHLRQRPLALSIGDKSQLCQTIARMTRGEQFLGRAFVQFCCSISEC
jgi:ATP-dependent Zn protease